MKLVRHVCPGGVLNAIVAYCTHERKVVVTLGRLRLGARLPAMSRYEVLILLRWQWLPSKAERERIRRWIEDGPIP